MAVRAKMYLDSITKTNWGSTIKLRVVGRGEDNKAWAAATPVGELSLTIKNEAAFSQFDLSPGTPAPEFYIDITPVPTDQVGQEGMG